MTSNQFMRDATRDMEPAPPIPTERPTAARTYGWVLGSKDNFEVDRELTLQVHKVFPEMTDIARDNRRYLYRAVRFLAEEAGISQFLDLGSGLPTENNVHQVAQRFAPEARVVYVDNDPIVLAHGRALLAEDESSTVISADLTEPDAVWEQANATGLLDPSEPLGVLMFSIPHCIPDEKTAQRSIHGPMGRAADGSYLAISHVVADDDETAASVNDLITGLGMPFNARTPEVFGEWLRAWSPVEPGLVDVRDWRPDTTQPALSDVATVLQQYLGASQKQRRIHEYGGVLRK